MPHLKLRDGAELYYENAWQRGRRMFLVPGLGGDGRFWGRPCRGPLPRNSPWSCTITAARRAAPLSKIVYSVEQMGRTTPCS